MRLLFLCYFFLLLTSCTPQRKPQVDTQPDRERIHGIRFDFTELVAPESSELTKVSASLCNDNADTVYFLTTTCFGEIYSLRFDERQLELHPRIVCNVSYPCVARIPPKGCHTFTAYFKRLRKNVPLRLGFDLYTVDGPNSVNLVDPELNIFNRPPGEQTILWAPEKP